MRPKLLIPVALVALVATLAVVRRDPAFEPYSPESLRQLLERPLDPPPSAPRTEIPNEAPPFWKALLEPPFAVRTDSGTQLRLGVLLSDPTVAHASALSAGELLELEAEGPDGPLGMPLWRAILEGPAVQRGDARSLKLYGCRHLADALSGPSIEDSYFARLALAAGLRAHAGNEPLEILGTETPIKGGLNFDVQLVNGVQSVRVSIDGNDAPLRTASRPFASGAPHDLAVRATLVELLRAKAAGEPALGELLLEGVEQPVLEGVELRLEWFGGRLSITAKQGSERIAAHQVLSEDPSTDG